MSETMLSVGQSVDTTTVLLSEADCVAFAEAYDPQPMHVDPDQAEHSFFGGLVASGWQVLSVTMRLIVEARPLGDAPLIGAEISAIRFARPVRPEILIRARATLDELRPRRSGGQFAIVTVETFDDRAGDLLVTQTWRMFLP